MADFHAYQPALWCHCHASLSECFADFCQTKPDFCLEFFAELRECLCHQKLNCLREEGKVRDLLRGGV